MQERTERSEPVQVMLLANAGLLIRCGETGILLDGIYGREPHMFSNLPPDCWNAMQQGDPPFSTVDYWLFTHRHPDHFNPAMAEELLTVQQPKGIFFPEECHPGLEALERCALTHLVCCTVLKDNAASAEYPLVPGISLRAIPTTHLDSKCRDVKHVCYLLTCGRKKLFFTGDMDYFHESLPELAEISLDAIFVNPLFYHAIGGERIACHMQVKNAVCIYHIPFLEDDKMGIRRMVERDMRNKRAMPFVTLPLDTPYQTISL